MAVGARPSYIRLQFLTESVVLSLAGGALGMIGGGSAAAVIAWYLKWPSLVSDLQWQLLRFFDRNWDFLRILPAHKAAALDPIEALRYE
jgi:putative ABC transport system permease protein